VAEWSLVPADRRISFSLFLSLPLSLPFLRSPCLSLIFQSRAEGADFFRCFADPGDDLSRDAFFRRRSRLIHRHPIASNDSNQIPPIFTATRKRMCWWNTLSSLCCSMCNRFLMEHVIYRCYQSIIHGKMRCATFVHDRLARLIITVAILEKSHQNMRVKAHPMIIKNLPIVKKFKKNVTVILRFQMSTQDCHWNGAL